MMPVMQSLKQQMRHVTVTIMACALVAFASAQSTKPGTAQQKGEKGMQLGNFSVSLAVKDLAASRAFYEKLGFHAIMGQGRFLILQNDTATIGLFQGMFDKNIMTFNPGWDRSANTLKNFDDVREIQHQLESQGVKLATRADEASTGPASFTLYDPDGNQIVVDQHVNKPAK
jgi:catechol 2,3-dioxygenase-like lactoylglutathione lyase family enzyme